MENRNHPDPNNEIRKNWDDEDGEKSGFISELLNRLKGTEKKPEEDDEEEEKKPLGIAQKAEKEAQKEKRSDKGLFSRVFGFLVSKEEQLEPPAEAQETQYPAEPPRAAISEAEAPEWPLRADRQEQPLQETEQPQVEQPVQKRELRPISGGQTDGTGPEIPEEHPETKPQQAEETGHINQVQENPDLNQFGAEVPPAHQAEKARQEARSQLVQETRPAHPLDQENMRISSVFPALAVDVMSRGRDRKEKRIRGNADNKLSGRIDKTEAELADHASRLEQQRSRAEQTAQTEKAGAQKIEQVIYQQSELEHDQQIKRAAESSQKDSTESTQPPPEIILKEVEKAAEKNVPIEGLFERSHEVKERPAAGGISAGFDSSTNLGHSEQEKRFAGETIGSRDLNSQQKPLPSQYTKAVQSGLITAVVIIAAIVAAIVFF